MKDTESCPKEMIAEACRYPAGHPTRQKKLTAIIRIVSPQLWKEASPYYEDALQKTWIYFCQNLCEGVTGKAYDSQKASIITWLNIYLKRRLQDGYNALQKQRATRAHSRCQDSTTQDSATDLIDRLAARPDIPPLLEEVHHWAITTPQLLDIHIKAYPNITAQQLILARLPPEVPWKVLTADLNVPLGTLSSFYQRQCMPLLREFGRSQGYL
ncbi:MAG: sigma-70 family RNA polymerase sigma factor [Cyanobacteria bacterium J06614_10]